MYLENKDGEFILHNLPNLAQVSATNQILVGDFDKDSNLDVVLAGNLYMTEVETPRNDAGIGLFLKGDGNGNFKAIPSYTSGLYVPGDVKDLTKINIKGKAYLLFVKNYDNIQFVRVN